MLDKIIFLPLLVKPIKTIMIHDFVKSMCDFSFGMLFMSQLIFTAAIYQKGLKYDLQKMMFRFMLYLLLISVIEFYLFYCSGTYAMHLSSPITDFMEMTVVPCVLFIIIRLTNPLQDQRWLIAVNAVIYFGAFAAYLITGNDAIHLTLLLFTIIYSVGIVVYGYFAVKRFNRQLESDFSNEELSLYWLKYIVYLYIGMLFVWSADTFIPSEMIAVVYNIMIMLMIGMFCYFVYRQDDMLRALECLNKEEIEEEPVKSYGFEVRFQNAFAKEKVYLNPKLNIVELAMAVGTNRTYISNYINQQLHTTFYEYVNKWRVKHAKELLASTDLSLEDISIKAGFNSLSSFRRYFTRSVEMAPMAFRRAAEMQSMETVGD